MADQTNPLSDPDLTVGEVPADSSASWSLDDTYSAEARERWGNSLAWKQSQQRTSRYTAKEWEEIKAEVAEVDRAFAAAMDAGPATTPVAMDAAEGHRRHLTARFYDVDHDLHRGLADLYVLDPRFTENYDNQRPGMAQFVHDAIYANAARANSDQAGRDPARGEGQH